MTTFNYEELACRTKSPDFHADKVSMAIFLAVVAACISNLEALDRIKKSLFYGKENFNINNVEINCSALQNINGLSIDQSRDIVHSILGKATEAGEQLELLIASVRDYLPFDVTNFLEEIGDGQWYDAIGVTAVGTTIHQVQLTNTAKLQNKFSGRYKTGDFNASEAINRDHAAERTILEAHAEGMDDTAAHAMAQKQKEQVDSDKLLSTDDAQVWAKEFAKRFPIIDEDAMIGWFANCAETAKMLERQRISERELSKPIQP